MNVPTPPQIGLLDESLPPSVRAALWTNLLVASLRTERKAPGSAVALYRTASPIGRRPAA
jgi:hypothetical protein